MERSTIAFPLDCLMPGDTMLFRPQPVAWTHPTTWAGAFVGQAIAWKTWHNISHVEIYIGAGEVVASRDGIGVNRYPVRSDLVAYVLRPPAGAFDLAAALAWFEAHAKGQGYDWLGLSRFYRTHIAQSTTKMFCSAFWLRFYRAGGFHPFHARIDADSICPGEILDAPLLSTVWCDGRVDFDADGV
jgi:uncharacterized protein YycO